jgi:hypothetical protein
MANSKITPKEIFEPYLFSDQHYEIEKEYSGFHEAIYEAMEKYAEQFKAEQNPVSDDNQVLKSADDILEKFSSNYKKWVTSEKPLFNLQLNGHEALNAIEAALQTNVGFGEWIDVKDRLPDTGVLGCVNVLCLIKGANHYILDFVNDAGQRYFYLNQQNKFENWTQYVTHWQPLPAPPVNNKNKLNNG